MYSNVRVNEIVGWRSFASPTKAKEVLLLLITKAMYENELIQISFHFPVSASLSVLWKRLQQVYR